MVRLPSPTPDMQAKLDKARRELYGIPDPGDIPGFQPKEEGFESPGGPQPIWTAEDAANRELVSRINAKRQIISLLQDEILELESRMT